MPWLGTFHSVAARMLRSHAELVGLQSNFTILDTDDQLRVLKQLIQAANLDEKRWPARQLAGLIDRWKNRGWTPQQVDAGESEAFAAGRGAELYAQYQERLQDPERLRLRRPAAPHAGDLPHATPTCSNAIATASATSSSTNIRTPTRASTNG